MQESEQVSGVTIHAGFPNPAADRGMSGLNLNQLLIQHVHSTYLFRLRGHAWEALGIFDDDIAIVDRAVSARASDVVVWWHDAQDEFAVSKFKDIPSGATLWGVITSTIHQLRKGNV